MNSMVVAKLVVISSFVEILNLPDDLVVLIKFQFN